METAAKLSETELRITVQNIIYMYVIQLMPKKVGMDKLGEDSNGLQVLFFKTC